MWYALFLIIQQGKVMIYGKAGEKLLISFSLILMLTGIYFGKPRGFGHNEKGEDIGFNTEVYSASEVVDWTWDWSLLFPFDYLVIYFYI